MIEEVTGRPMKWRYIEENRVGDHICYYSDLRKIKSHFPAWPGPPREFPHNRNLWLRPQYYCSIFLGRMEGLTIIGIDNLARPGSETNRRNLTIVRDSTTFHG